MKRALNLILLFVMFITLLCSCAPQKSEKKQIDFLNVGKADAIFIQTTNTVTLIDTGYDRTDDVILEFLEENKIETIDHLILTHFDKDHIGGTKDVFENVNVKNVYFPDYEGTINKYEEFLECLEEYEVSTFCVKKDIVLNLESDTTLTINPTALTSITDDNNYSLIVSFVAGNYKALFLGDALKERISEYMKKDSSKYNLIKLPHHGDYFKKMEELVVAAKPSYAVITVDESEEIVEQNLIDMCSDLGIRLLRTDEGSIRIVYSSENGTGSLVTKTEK